MFDKEYHVCSHKNQLLMLLLQVSGMPHVNCIASPLSYYFPDYKRDGKIIQEGDSHEVTELVFP